MLKFVQLVLIASLLSLVTLQTYAVTPSPAMIEQFKKLPSAEQERLAKQYGFDVSLLRQGQSPSSAANERSKSVTELTQIRRDEQQLAGSRLQPKSDEAERFGLRMFDAEISTFAPVSAMPVPDNYMLGADDQLLLQLFGKQNSEVRLTVSRDGKVFVPDVGPLTVGGLNFSTAANLIVERVQQATIGVNAAISMGELRTINVFVAGEAKYPGAYAVSALTTVTQALFTAGGVSDIGSLREITVRRAGATVAQFDLYDLLLRGDNKNDVHLQHGDVVFVAPVTTLAEVRGEVKRPAIYEVKPKESLADLLSMAGGTKAGAYPRAAVLERFDNNVRTLQNLDLTDTNTRQMRINSGDVLRVDAASLQAENQIVIAGAAARPGFYAWRSGIKVTDLIRNHWSDLLPTADLDYALIVREGTPGTITEFLQFSPAKAIAKPNGTDDLQLQPRDRILLFHYANEAFERIKLDAKLRDNITEKLKSNSDQRWLMADLTKSAFELLAENEVPLPPSGDAIEIPTEHLSVEEQHRLLTAELSHIFSNLFTNPKVLLLSKHLSRKEILYPILQQLRLQSRNDNSLATVSVSGAVRVPGEYPLSIGSRVSDLIAAAGGLTDAAYINQAELSRVIKQADNRNGVEVSHKRLNLQQLFTENDSDNIALQNRDRLNIFSVPNWTSQREITLEGEVRFPGTYTVQQGETLSQVIARAGGVTENSFLFGAVFTREQIKEKETVQYAKLVEQLKSDVATRALAAQGNQIAPADAMLMLREIERIRPIGRLVIDLEQAIAGNPAFDISVEHGDKLIVPRINRSVTIVGEVQHVGTHRYDAARTVQQYLQLAGGLRKRADAERTYVIRADGSVMVPTNSWFAVSRGELKPGDTIIVPLDTEYKDNLSLWAQVTQIFYQSAVAIAALNSF
ncbi:SLBB domain-containing protein [Rheinheimera oceanensis]|uniref:SLBB domain-containing protein n=1 Tax=Rheinheimera oceanensis TaxID=2817449 RepID=UPI0032E8F640